MQYKTTHGLSRMNCPIRYRFESSDDIQTLTVSKNEIKLEALIQMILKDIFKDADPSCCLEATNISDKTINNKTEMPIVFKRTYMQRFVLSKKKRKKEKPPPPPYPPPKRIRQRWRSRSPIQRIRWRSSSPKRIW